MLESIIAFDMHIDEKPLDVSVSIIVISKIFIYDILS